MNRGNYALGVSSALFIIWMQRNHRWALFLQAMQGNIKIAPRT